MKKKMKPILFTMFILAAVTAGGVLFSLVPKGLRAIIGFSKSASVLLIRRSKAQNDLEENRSYRYDLDESAIPLATSGEKKNVLNFEHDVVYDVQQSNRDRERLDRLMITNSCVLERLFSLPLLI